MDASDIKDVKLSAEVDPFIPQTKGLEGSLVSMSLSGEPGGGNAGVETTPIPSYLITCYPFVQENQPNRQHPVYNGGDLRWHQPNPGPGGPYLAYPIMSSPQPPVSNDYTYYQIMPAPCPPMMGFYQPFPGTYAGPVQPGVVNPVSTDVGERPLPVGPAYGIANHRGRGMVRSNMPKQHLGVCQPQRGRRPPSRTLAVQKEVCNNGYDGWTKKVLLVDAAQQTDFPGEVSGRCFGEPASPLLWKNRTKRQQASNAAESYSDQGTSEADIDSDSGYCSPKHKQAAGLTHRTVETSTSCTGVETGVMTSTWVNFHRADQRKNPEQSNFSQDFHSACPGRGCPNQSEQRLQPVLVTRDEITTEPLYFEDEDERDEFPDLPTGNGVQRCAKADAPSQTQTQPKLCRNLLENVADNSPISIVQTPIPITTSVPKRAKSQRKKALAAAVATAQEYSEISMEQQKLQEALTKAAGKKSKTPVTLDLGDMLADLAKQQLALKAKQITNTKPLSFAVGTTMPFHSTGSLTAMLKGHPQPYLGSPNTLDSTAPRIKRGKEREIPKVKRPTALKKIILKEREGKKGKTSSAPELPSQEEQRDDCLHFTEDLSQEPASQEENGLCVPSDTSLSPASQNSPYSITPVSQGSPSSSGIGSPMASNALTIIHSRRFREYCSQVLNKEIDESATLLLQELVRFQDRFYHKDPNKAKSKRRLVMGLREVTKHMKLRKIKCVIISPNCEKIQAKGGLDEALYNVIAMAREQGIPFVFALGRKALGRCVNKLVAVSLVGIFNYSGAESLFDHLVSLTEQARQAYKDMVSSLEQEQAEEALKHVKKVSHMGHSRNHSAASATSFCSVISEPISEVNEKEYETNWRSMVETSDAPEPVEAEKSVPSPSIAPPRDNETPAVPTTAAPQRAPLPTQAHAERDEVRADDRLELASQQSTETGSLDGSCRGPLNSSITSTTSTLVPGMLEEAEEEDEEEEDDTPEPISVEVPTLNSRIESWVSKTLENMQLGKSQDSTDEEEEEEEEEEEDDEEEEEEEDEDDEEEERAQSDDEEGLVSDAIADTNVESREQVVAKEVTA
ncbi:selenocysteine insertion sequence-binding protein 2-like isoform X2 [Syngnathus acus]|uniref:selenocysteine insertion sequence-binding protein 2-like isoform X2 n=1 Tax=Syngnathus acus TaxID=161584 RepID=UPI0018862183|nr:selenocysteine insertion sequence-binding protein 2-like isoform X2 [Syngnathus acus]